MEIRFRKNEIGRLAAVLVSVYDLRDSLEDAKDVIEMAIKLAHIMDAGVVITMRYKYMYTCTFVGKDAKKIGVISVGVDGYVYRFS